MAPASYPALAVPGVSSTYFSPSADFGRTRKVESIGSGSRSLSSFSVRRAVASPSLLGTGSMSETTPTRAPPMRTSFPATRFAALGSSALTS
jgi:hypothetical protein